MVYRFIDKYKAEFGLRWLLRKFNLYPNAYYNYIKDRKSEYRKEKVKVQEAIKSVERQIIALTNCITRSKYSYKIKIT